MFPEDEMAPMPKMEEEMPGDPMAGGLPPLPMGGKAAMAQSVGVPASDMYYNPVTESPEFDASIFPEASGDPMTPGGGEEMNMGMDMGGPPPVDPSNPMTQRNREDAIGMLASKAKARLASSEKFQAKTHDENKSGGY